MVTQSESPRFNTTVFREIFDCYRGIFGTENVSCYLAHIPTYPSGMWSFSFSSKNGRTPQDFDPVKADAFTSQHKLKYYNSDIHTAAFALPNFVRELLNGTPADV